MAELDESGGFWDPNPPAPKKKKKAPSVQRGDPGGDTSFLEWAKSVPGAAKQLNQDVANWMTQVPGAAAQAYGDISRPLQGGAADIVHWLTGDPTMQEVARRDLGGGGAADAPALAPYEDVIGGKKYKFNVVTDPYGQVQDYTAQGPVGGGPVPKDMRKYVKGLPDSNELFTGPADKRRLTDPAQLSDKEYDALTKAATKGNKLAQEILVKGKYKAQNFPNLTQDLAKVTDPFVKALSNMPQMAGALESQVQAVTQPYDFTNAETQVNNILANQGSTARMTPSAQTSAYANKLGQLADVNPLASGAASDILRAAGFPGSIGGALTQLGPAAKVSEKAAPTAALLGAILSHLQYQDVYGTGLSSALGKSTPNWLQALIASVGQSALGGALPGINTAAGAAGTLPSTGSTVPGVSQAG